LCWKSFEEIDEFGKVWSLTKSGRGTDFTTSGAKVDDLDLIGVELGRLFIEYQSREHSSKHTKHKDIPWRRFIEM